MRHSGMSIVGYARVSAVEQNTDGQLDALVVAGCERVFTTPRRVS